MYLPFQRNQYKRQPKQKDKSTQTPMSWKPEPLPDWQEYLWRQELLMQELLRQQPCEQKLLGQELHKQEIFRQNPCQQKLLGQESYKQEIFRQEPCKQKLHRQESCKQEILRQEPSKQEPSRLKATTPSCLRCPATTTLCPSHRKSPPPIVPLFQEVSTIFTTCIRIGLRGCLPDSEFCHN